MLEDLKHPSQPSSEPGVPGWLWARRWVARWPAEDIRRIMIAAVRERRRDIRKGRWSKPMWGYVMDPAGCGSTVAAAIFERWRYERAREAVKAFESREAADATPV